MKCPLCGFEFDAGEMSCHSSCAFNESCGIICCPNCGYQVTDMSKSKVAAFLENLLNRRKQREAEYEAAGVRPLSALKSGQSCKVVSIKDQHGRQERLNVFGLIPGATVVLQQRRPAFVLRVGFTELSIERNIADEIMVELDTVKSA